jgi:hypothetical protein
LGGVVHSVNAGAVSSDWVGIVVNVNLIVFYAARLQTVMAVVAERNCKSSHAPTMLMNWMDASLGLHVALRRTSL